MVIKYWMKTWVWIWNPLGTDKETMRGFWDGKVSIMLATQAWGMSSDPCHSCKSRAGSPADKDLTGSHWSAYVAKSMTSTPKRNLSQKEGGEQMKETPEVNFWSTHTHTCVQRYLTHAHSHTHMHTLTHNNHTQSWGKSTQIPGESESHVTKGWRTYTSKWLLVFQWLYNILAVSVNGQLQYIIPHFSN